MVLCRINNAYSGLRLRGEMDRLFEGFLEGGPAAVFGGRSFPAFQAELAGVKLEDLEVYVIDDELTVKGERTNTEREGVTYHRRERGVGPFSRVLRLPVEVDADKVEATLRDGVLTIKLPKADAVLPRRIEVVGQ